LKSWKLQIRIECNGADGSFVSFEGSFQSWVFGGVEGDATSGVHAFDF